MRKRLNLFILISATAITTVYAQWTEKDSLKLQQILKEEGDIELNKNVIRQIDFGSFIGAPKEIDNDPGLEWDTKLPEAKPENLHIQLSLRPYTATTPYNYDPIRRTKFKVNSNTWRSNPFYTMTRQTEVPTHLKRTIKFHTKDNQDTKIVEALEIRKNSIPGTYTQVGGVGFGGLDFNALTTREFWDKSIGKRRARTLEVLKFYGDSTTVNIKTPIRVIHTK